MATTSHFILYKHIKQSEFIGLFCYLSINYLSYVELVYLLIMFLRIPVSPRQLIQVNMHKTIENIQIKKIAMAM